MLRQFFQNRDLKLVESAINKFSIDVSDIQLLDSWMISPDSFMWRLEINNTVYYLYAEDYVPSLGHIKEVFNEHVDGHWSLIPVKEKVTFHKASPVTSATVYEEPSDSDEILKYGTTSGYDFVFLCKA